MKTLSGADALRGPSASASRHGLTSLGEELQGGLVGVEAKLRDLREGRGEDELGRREKGRVVDAGHADDVTRDLRGSAAEETDAVVDDELPLRVIATGEADRVGEEQTAVMTDLTPHTCTNQQRTLRPLIS